jgi:hypothetical protein
MDTAEEKKYAEDDEEGEEESSSYEPSDYGQYILYFCLNI